MTIWTKQTRVIGGTVHHAHRTAIGTRALRRTVRVVHVRINGDASLVDMVAKCTRGKRRRDDRRWRGDLGHR